MLYGTCGLRRRPRCCSMDHKTDGKDAIPAGTEPIPSERIDSFPSPPRRDGHQDDFSQGFFGVAVLNAGSLSTPQQSVDMKVQTERPTIANIARVEHFVIIPSGFMCPPSGKQWNASFNWGSTRFGEVGPVQQAYEAHSDLNVYNLTFQLLLNSEHERICFSSSPVVAMLIMHHGK